MTTPPIDKGKGKQLLYSQESSPRLSPIQRPRYTSSPPTAVIRPGDSTPSPISPNVADDFAVTSSVPLRRTLSSESSKLRKEIEKMKTPAMGLTATVRSLLLAVRVVCGCYAQALGVVEVGSLSVEISRRIWVRSSRPSCRASQGQNRGVRRGYRVSGDVR